MKFLRLTGILLLFIAGITIVLSLVLPAKQTIERTVTVKAPASLVYAQLSKLSAFNKWSVWNRNDSSVTNVVSANDGTVGATTTWKGDPVLSGDGKIEITELEENKKVAQSIHFLSPRDGRANSVFTIDERNGMTTVTWHFEMLTPRPWNIFNLFYKMEKEMGNDFDQGLANLKEQVEKTAGTVTPGYKVTEMNFPPTSFALIRQRINMKDITSYFTTHLPVLYTETGNAGITAGTPTGLYFEWDDKAQLTDMAAAVPVSPGAKIDNAIVTIMNIPQTKAISANYNGSYENIRDAYSSLDNFLSEKKLTRKSPVIEQYITGPQQEADTSRWLTRIVYLID
jgi:effector-binding domain-containing protein/uncharacterized protein YndB with AHSA1/START domain